ncbi:MAG: dihydroorotate dehydrogenase [Candidatus Helarchaeota archaeon]
MPIIATVKFENVLMNASGIFSDSPFLLRIWEESGAGAVITKSITLYEKKPNPFSYDDGKIICIRGKDYTINSMGLPNKGLIWWKEKLQKISYRVPLIISVATHTGDFSEYAKIISELESLADMFEINVSCPNTQNEITGYNLESMNELLSKIETKKPISVKLPCYFENDSFKEVLLEFDEFGKYLLKERVVVRVPTQINENFLNKILNLLQDFNIKCVTSHNTIPITHPLLSTPRGGLSGRPIHAIAIKQAKKISENSNIDIIGSGGILTSKDVIDFLEIKNVKAVQLASGLFQYENPAIFINKLKEGLTRYF